MTLVFFFKSWNSSLKILNETNFFNNGCIFTILFFRKIKKLVPHAYITQQQVKYLTERKDNLRENKALVLTDFAENYGFSVQDESQGYNWNHARCTLHPALVYYKKDKKICSKSFCFISCPCCSFRMESAIEDKQFFQVELSVD
jgi:hypothetical protein